MSYEKSHYKRETGMSELKGAKEGHSQRIFNEDLSQRINEKKEGSTCNVRSLLTNE